MKINLTLIENDLKDYDSDLKSVGWPNGESVVALFLACYD